MSKGKKVYLFMDQGVAPEIFTNMTKLSDKYPVIEYRTLIQRMRKHNYYAWGRYEIWRLFIQ